MVLKLFAISYSRNSDISMLSEVGDKFLPVEQSIHLRPFS